MDYVIEYKTDRTTAPYTPPECIKTQLRRLGVDILYSRTDKPVVIASMPAENIPKVRSLESITAVYDNFDEEKLAEIMNLAT